MPERLPRDPRSSAVLDQFAAAYARVQEVRRVGTDRAIAHAEANFAQCGEAFAILLVNSGYGIPQPAVSDTAHQPTRAVVDTERTPSPQVSRYHLDCGHTVARRHQSNKQRAVCEKCPPVDSRRA